MDKLPHNAQVFNTKMDLKKKFDTAGAYTKHKARLVVLGNEEPIDPSRDDYSPTANHKSLFLLFAVAAQHDLQLSGFDIEAAFLTADIDSTNLYIRLPANIDLPSDSQPPSQYARLRKSVYGLRRSPGLYNKELTGHLVAGGYQQSIHDRCLFYKRQSPTKLIAFVIHVDDFAIAASSL